MTNKQKLEEDWIGFIRNESRKQLNLTPKTLVPKLNSFVNGAHLARANYTKIPEVAELIEALRHVKASAHMGIGLHRDGGLNLSEVEKGLNNIIDSIDEVINKIKGESK